MRLLSPALTRRFAGWLLWPVLFQMFLVVGALDPILASGSESGPALQICAVSGLQWVSVQPSADTPSIPDHGVQPGHTHCPLCSSLALSLPTDPPLQPSALRVRPSLHRVSPPRVRVSSSGDFFRPYPHAPPTVSPFLVG